METTVCNLCQSPAAVPVLRSADYLLGQLDPEYTYVRCEQCGFIYLNPRPSTDEMAPFYPDSYDSYQAAPAGRWTHQYGMQKRCQEVMRYQRHGRILDVGCSNGSFLAAMQSLGWQVQGVEINAHAAALARQAGLDVFSGTLEQAGYPPGTFEAVTLWDVLEHLHQPIESLREIRRILKPEGVLVLKVPNGASWEARRFGRAWSGVDAPRHTCLFTPTTLHRALTCTGFTVLSQHNRIGSYSFFPLSVRFWLTQKRCSPRWIKLAERLLAHPFTRLCAAPLFGLLNTGLHGASLVAAARPGAQP